MNFKPVRQTLLANGARRVVVDIVDGQDLVLVPKQAKAVVITDGSHLRLGHPMDDDVVAAHVLQKAEVVQWCSIQQKWV